MGSATAELLPLAVEIVRTTVVQPDYAGSPAVPPTKEVPLNVFDKLAMDAHVACLYAFSSPTPSNSTILRALSTTLAHFPTLAGRFSADGCRRSILIAPGSTAGMLVLEAEAKQSCLSDFLPLAPSQDCLLLHPPIQRAAHLSQAQLTRFRCGGLVLGFTTHHQVADGQSMSLFYTALGCAIRGLPVEPRPSYDQTWLQPRIPPRCEFEHWGVEFSRRSGASNDGEAEGRVSGELRESGPISVKGIRTVQLHFSAEFIQTLRHQLPPDQKYSTFQVLLAHLWRKITIARGLHPDSSTHIRIAVNGRPRLHRRAVPPTFFGNLVLHARPCAKAVDLTAMGGIALAAQLIRQAIAETGDAYLQSVMDFGALHRDETLIPACDDDWVMYPNLEVDSWLRFKFEKLDFGGGGLRGFSTTWIPAEGVIVMSPEFGSGDKNDKKGGTPADVCASVSLFEEHARQLIKIAYSTD